MEDSTTNNSATDPQTSLFDATAPSTPAPVEQLTAELDDSIEIVTAESDPPKVRASKTFLQPAIIRAEANTLRFPMFKLDKTGLKTCDGFVVTGKRDDGGKSYDFSYRITRNTDDKYPGAFARKVHQGLLALLEKQGFPYQQSVTFTYRDLAKVMGISWHGRLPIQIREAIRSIHGLRIWSDLALKRKTRVTDIKSKKEKDIVEPLANREHGFSIYQEVVFQDDTLDNGTVADINSVVFSQWFITNLNSFYYAKIDRELWLALDAECPTASRLYEYLLHSASGDWKTFKIAYEKLCMFLPVRVYGPTSHAKRQFADAIEALKKHRIISGVKWGENSSGQRMMTFVFGDSLRTTKTPSTVVAPSIDDDSIVVEELSSSKAEDLTLIAAFYERWANRPNHVPYDKERAFAQEIIQDYTFDVASQILREVIKLTEENFSEAKTFNATRKFWPEAFQLYLKRQAAKRAEQKREAQKARERAKHKKEKEQFIKDKEAFLALPASEQARIEEQMYLTVTPAEVAHFKRSESGRLVACVYEFQRDQGRGPARPNQAK